MIYIKGISLNQFFFKYKYKNQYENKIVTINDVNYIITNYFIITKKNKINNI
jgi:hypothetical protein